MWLVGFFLSTIFIFEGLGIYGGHEISILFISLFPFFLLLYNKITGQQMKLRIPKTLAICYSVFLFFLAISTFFSVNVVQSLPGLSYYPALFFISVYSYNHKKEISGWLLPFLTIISLILVVFSIFGWFYPNRGYGLLYNSLNFHNNIGDFLVIPIVASVYYLMEGKMKKVSIAVLLITTPVFLLSFSRSAYTAVIIAVTAMFIFRRVKTKSFYLTVFTIFLLAGLFYFIPNVNFPSGLHNLSKYVSHRDDIISFRDSFFISALRGIRDYPVTGAGFGNFGKLSFRYNDLYLFWSRSSHNIFLDLASEIGLPAMAAFLIPIIYLLKKSKKNVLFYVFLGILANFQLYYSFGIYSIAFVFFILLGLLYDESSSYKVAVTGNKLLLLFSIPLLVIQIGFLSRILINRGYYKAALFLDPTNTYLYRAVIQKTASRGEYRDNILYRNIYGRIYYSDLEVTEYLAGIDLNYRDKNAALAKYQRSMMWNPYSGDQALRLKRLYYLTYELKGKPEADRFLSNYSKRVEGMFEYDGSSIKAISREVANGINPPLLAN